MYVHAPCVCTYVCTLCTETKRFLFAQNNDQSTLIRGGGRRAGYCLNVLVYVVSEATRNCFRDHKFKHFLEEHPQNPHLCSYTVLYNSVADLGLSEGGFCYSIVCKKFATTPIFDRFGERLLALPVNRSVLDQDLC